MARYLNLSELAHVRWLASEAVRWRRPRRASRARIYVPPPIPAPRRPVDLDVLFRVVEELRALPGVA